MNQDHWATDLIFNTFAFSAFAISRVQEKS